jgi:hypothetical protein
VFAAQQAVEPDCQQLGSIDPGCHLAAYSVGRVEAGQRCCQPLNADPLGGEIDPMQIVTHTPLVSLAGLIAVLGCSTPQTASFSPTTFTPQGDYQHVITGLKFPREVGRYERHHVSRYDQEFHNVSGHYELRAPNWGIATIYHYPASGDGSFPTYAELESKFEEAKRDIAFTRSGATLVSEAESLASVNGASLKGRKATYSVDWPDDDEGPITSSLYVYALENWYLKFRFSHAESDSQHAARLEMEFIEAIRWPIPGGGSPTSHPKGCISIADVYELIARNKDGGLTEDQQIEMLGEPGNSTEDRHAHMLMLNAVSVAAAFPDKTSLQIRNLVLDDCSTNEDGQASLNRFWPWKHKTIGNRERPPNKALNADVE